MSLELNKKALRIEMALSDEKKQLDVLKIELANLSSPERIRNLINISGIKMQNINQDQIINNKINKASSDNTNLMLVSQKKEKHTWRYVNLPNEYKINP